MSNHRWDRPSFSDGYLEVVGLGTAALGVVTSLQKSGVASTLEAAGIGSRIATAGVRLAQGSHLTIRVKGSGRLPMQIDGEPWTQAPSRVDIKFHGDGQPTAGRARMLQRFQPVTDDSAELLTSVLDWAELTDIINSKQREKLLNEVSRRRQSSISDAKFYDANVVGA